MKDYVKQITLNRLKTEYKIEFSSPYNKIEIVDYLIDENESRALDNVDFLIKRICISDIVSFERLREYNKMLSIFEYKHIYKCLYNFTENEASKVFSMNFNKNQYKEVYCGIISTDSELHKFGNMLTIK